MKIASVQTIPITPKGHGTLGYLVIVRTHDGLAGVGEIASDCHPATVAHAVRRMQLRCLQRLCPVARVPVSEP